MKRAIFLYDYTGIMAQPWLDAGYECWLFDGQHSSGVKRYGNLIKVGMFFQSHAVLTMAQQIKHLVGDACFVFGFPECTNLTNSGSKHWGGEVKS